MLFKFNFSFDTFFSCGSVMSFSFVPEFDLEDDDPVTSAAPVDHHNRKIISQSHEDDESHLLELLWQQGPVVRPLEPAAALPPERSHVGSTAEASHRQQQLFMEEDEMATWLHHYQEGGGRGGGGSDLYSEMMGPSSRASCCSQVTGVQQVKHQQAAAAMAAAAAAARQGSLSVVAVDAGKVFDAGSVRASVAECSMHVSDRKRKGAPRAEKDTENVEVEYGNKRKDGRQSAPQRTRTAEVHNLSERRRRDRINEKMKALQELIPRCNKSDKASMLDDAIEYMKSLQLQVQMMSSMQYNMGQMMFPDAQRYLQAMGFIGMGMGMPSGGMQRLEMPFGSILPYPPVVGPSPENLQPRLVPSFHPANAAIPGQVRMEASNQQDPLSSSIGVMGPNMAQIPNLADPYHHYAPLHHLQVPFQGQTLGEPGTSKETDNTKRSTG